MIERDYFSHDIPGYGKVFDVMTDKGYCYHLAGENIGWNNYQRRRPRPRRSTACSWTRRGHRANILGKAWDVIGVGAYKGADGKKMWTVLFADKCGSAHPKPTPTAQAEAQAGQAEAEADARSPRARRRSRRRSRRPSRRRCRRRPRSLTPAPTARDRPRHRRRAGPIRRRRSTRGSRARRRPPAPIADIGGGDHGLRVIDAAPAGPASTRSSDGVTGFFFGA